MLRSMPIPCVDIIVKRDGKILIGFRKIEPYRNCWALLGGRILKHDRPEDTARRNLREIEVSADIRRLVGVFPVRFPNNPQKRYDITLCYESNWRSGEPKPNSELATFKWIPPSNIPIRMGGNNKKMIQAAVRLGIPST